MDILAKNGIEVLHHFSTGVYAKETKIPAGTTLGKHTHSYTHMSLLASGWAEVTKGEEVFTLRGPAIVEIKADTPHQVKALTDVVWFCIHATEETDEHNIDTTLLENT